MRALITPTHSFVSFSGLRYVNYFNLLIFVFGLIASAASQAKYTGTLVAIGGPGALIAIGVIWTLNQPGLQESKRGGWLLFAAVIAFALTAFSTLIFGLSDLSYHKIG